MLFLGYGTDDVHFSANSFALPRGVKPRKTDDLFSCRKWDPCIPWSLTI